MAKTDDDKIIEVLEADILARAKGLENFAVEVPKLIRRAIDEIIDTPRTARLTLDQLEKTEKTYIGTKIEILFRNFLDIPKGILDLNVNGVDVDIKNTIGKNWTIPPEAFGKACILIGSDEKAGLCRVGIVITHRELLNTGVNRDGKTTLSREGMSRVRWIIKDSPYPKNFWEDISPEVIRRIMLGKSGNERLTALFKEIQMIPISRQVIEGVARQKDYMKRLRKNGGARDRLAAEGILLFSGDYNGVEIRNLKLPGCNKGEFISVKDPDFRTAAKA